MTRAVLLDSLGTLLRLAPPAPRLRAELRRRGFDVDEAAAEGAFAAEIAYYLEHHTEGRDASSLAELRNRCAGVLSDALAIPELAPADARAAMLESLHFEPYPDAAPALRGLRDRGVRLAVASNWDCSLPEVLARVGLRDLVDGVVTSAEAGARKPDRAVFEAALAVAGCDPGEAVHVGDSLENDVAGASAAGIRPVLVRRAGGGPAPDGVTVIAGLDALPPLI